MSRLGPSFHRTFALNRPAIADILRLASHLQKASEKGRVLDFGLIEKNTTLGPVYISSMRRYLYGVGLVDKQERVTEMGARIAAVDPSLQSLTTCWLMHYRLSCKHGVGPSFWGKLACDLLRPGDILQRCQVAAAVRQAVSDAGERDVNDRTANQAATVFLGTYTKSDALGPLGMLEQQADGSFIVNEPSLPSLLTFAYILSDYWQANWGEVPGVHVSRVTEPGGPASLLMMGSGTVNRYLRDLQAAGFATVQRHMPPFQLNRNWPGPEVFLERLYG